MTIQQLIADYRTQGWEIDEQSLTLVSKVEGAEKYDVNVVSPDKVFGTAQIFVKGGEAEALGFWSNVGQTSFADRLNLFLRSMEGGDIFAITTLQIYEADRAAVVNAYSGTATVTVQQYIVRERANAFSFKAVI